MFLGLRELRSNEAIRIMIEIYGGGKEDGVLIWYYYVAFAASLLLSAFYVFRWHKHFNLNITVIYILVPISNLAFCMMYRSGSNLTMMLATKFVYIGACFLPWFVVMAIADLCKIKISKSIRFSSFVLSAMVFISVLTVGFSPVFYKYFYMEKIGGNYVAVKEYGFMHGVFYVMIMAYQVAGVAIILYSFFRKNQISRKILTLLFVPQLITLLGYFSNHIMPPGFDSVPATYVLAQIIYFFVADQIALYDVSEMVVESLVQSGDTGFITIDSGYRYLGSNETAKQIMPKLAELVADQSIKGRGEEEDRIVSWVDQFRIERHNGFRYSKQEGDDERFYSVTLDYLYDGTRRRGFQIFFKDDTENQRHMQLLDNYNEELERDVREKTESIVKMHDNLIVSMATMVESRDNSTGGHIKRTSQGVRILIEEMQKDGRFKMTEEFCKDIIKAAPMHDLGKIAVRDEILRKKGRFTPDEYDEMKKHAAEGARIVHEILKDTDDESFKIIAENVAHYHHERVDGSGYPEGLKGDEIPFEARIMAIADVYDALVSKRVYKEKMSFEEADAIIMEGMGKHFDKQLEEIYIKARPKLEAFYEEYERNETPPVDE